MKGEMTDSFEFYNRGGTIHICGVQTKRLLDRFGLGNPMMKNITSVKKTDKKYLTF